MCFFTLLITKIIIYIFRFLGRGATTFPGRIALFINPNILKRLTNNYRIIMVTGTNGKTTTTKIISKLLASQNIDHICNNSGANLVPGITTTLIEGHSVWGKPKKSTALIEIDEAAFLKISKMISCIDYLIVTNFFRDQLDRYGELYTTVRGVHDGLHNLSCKHLILNADDSLSSFLAKDFTSHVIYYGFDVDAYSLDTPIINTDANFCIFCKHEYKYTNRVYGHLGGFMCDNCGYHKADTQVSCSKILELSPSSSYINFKILSDEYTTKINLPGLYNVYNTLAGVSLAYSLQISIAKIIDSLQSFECSFGRMECISVGDKFIKLILVKNPAGFNQVINYLLSGDNNPTVAFLLNDNAADGTDISWIWDVDLENIILKNPTALVGGTRGFDMAVRLKYAGLNTSRIHISSDYAKLINNGLSLTKPGQSFYILPTYTALLHVRNILKNKFKLKEFWK